jgi:hypothetical protein
MSDILVSAPLESRPTDERYTPAWVFRALSERFDLDPASPVDGGDCVPATRKLTVCDDGLTSEWRPDEFVWLNPPFSNATPWARKFVNHANGIWLGPVANSQWMVEMADACDRFWLMRDFAFIHPKHAGKRSSMPLAMVGLGDRAARAIDRAGRFIGTAGGVVLRRQA